MEYRYDGVTIDNLGILALKIEKEVGLAPKGITDSGDSTVIIFPDELPIEQKTILDSLMTTKDIDVIPDNTLNTTFIVKDVFNNRDVIKAALGIDFDVYFKDDDYIIQFTTLLSAEEKDKVIAEFTKLLIEA
jgi:hypothetical protein